MTLQPETREPSNDPRGLNRRTVLKAGAHAAWAIPAVQVITQAPALAASGAADLSGGVMGTQTGAWTGSNAGSSFQAQVQVTNKNSLATTGLKVTLTFPTGYALSVSNIASGWTASGGHTATIVFTADNSHQAPGNGSTTVSATFTSTVSNNAGKAVTAQVAATPGPTGTPGAGSLSIAKK